MTTTKQELWTLREMLTETANEHKVHMIPRRWAADVLETIGAQASAGEPVSGFGAREIGWALVRVFGSFLDTEPLDILVETYRAMSKPDAFGNFESGGKEFCGNILSTIGSNIAWGNSESGYDENFAGDALQYIFRDTRDASLEAIITGYKEALTYYADGSIPDDLTVATPK